MNNIYEKGRQLCEDKSGINDLLTTEISMVDAVKLLDHGNLDILNMISDGICIKKDNKIIFNNFSASYMLTGKEDGIITGCDFTDFFLSSAGFEEEYNKAFRNEKLHGMSEAIYIKVIRSADHNEMDLEVCEKVIKYNDESISLNIIKDISDLKRSEKYKKDYEKINKVLGELIQYDKMKTEFFENLSHELRTPLNVILGVVQLEEYLFKDISGEGISEKTLNYTKVLKQNCYKLLRQVNNLLDMTKAESGYLRLKLKNSNIVSVVEDITMSVVEYAAGRGINVIFDTDVEEKVMAFDPDNVERIIMNLLSNAVKFTPQGKNIYVSVNDLDDKVVISVKDEGEGIPKEKQKNMFNRFVQVDNSYSRSRTGTGIGLSLVKSLVELHGGSIELISEIDKGSEFKVILPVTLVEDNLQNSEDNCIKQSKVERVSIEFSDIYQA